MASKPNIGSKPSFAVKPGALKKPAGPKLVSSTGISKGPIMTPNKNYDRDDNIVDDILQEQLDVEDDYVMTSQQKIIPNRGQISESKVDMYQRTPPPAYENSQNQLNNISNQQPQVRIEGTKQFSKPLKIAKKKFQLAPPDPNQAGVQNIYPITPKNEYDDPNIIADDVDGGFHYANARNSNSNSYLNLNQVESRMQQNNSRQNILKHDGSQNRLVEDKQLGPQIMKKKVTQQLAYNQMNPGPLPRAPSKQEQPQYQNAPISKPNLSQTRGQSQNYSNYQQEDNELLLETSQPQFNIQSKPQAFSNPAEGFIKQKNIIIQPKLESAYQNIQLRRASELRDLIQLSQEEIFNVFELIPQSTQDIYYNKLQSGVLKTQVTSCMDDLVEQEVQTDDLGSVQKSIQVPDDFFEQAITTKKQLDGQEEIKLEKFLERVGPVVERVIEQNIDQYFIDNRDKASQRSSFELKSCLKLPPEILFLFSESDAPAEVEKVTAIHMFETSPQSNCAIAYLLKRPQVVKQSFIDGRKSKISIIVIYSVSVNQFSNILYCNDEVTQICTTGNADIVIIGTVLGSFFLYDLKNSTESSTIPSQTSAQVTQESLIGGCTLQLNYLSLIKNLVPNFDDQKEARQQQIWTNALIKYGVKTHSYMTDGLIDYPHVGPIQKLIFLSKSVSGISKIGALDQYGCVSVWSVVEIHDNLSSADHDLQMNIGCKFKMTLNYTDSLLNYQNVKAASLGDDSTAFIPELFGADTKYSLDIEFDNNEPQFFFFSANGGLFKMDKREKNNPPIKMETLGLNQPCALSLCDKGLLLTSFACGSICLYEKEYTTPLTVWYYQSQFPITELKWCQLYFDDIGENIVQAGDKQTPVSPKKDKEIGFNEKEIVKKRGVTAQFAARVCEFFGIDKNENFIIWNLQKKTYQPAHSISFKDKHISDEYSKQFRISRTCADQSFFTAFALKDFSVNLYLMNFKKGSTITKKKLNDENRKSIKIIKTLPSINNF